MAISTASTATAEIPIVYGLLTTNDLQQAKDRSGGKLGNKGDEWCNCSYKNG